MDKKKDDVKEQKNIILEQLRRKGCRITRQREILIDVILKEPCNNCKEIYYMASKKDPNIGMATVYRMINTLEEIGALKWRNECQLYKGEYSSIKTCKIEFEDISHIELKEEMLHKVIEKGLERTGHLNGRKIKRVLILDR